MLLLWCLIVPFVFSMLCWQSECINIRTPRWIALIGMLIELILIFSIFYECDKHILTKFSNDISLNMEYYHSWIPNFGINVHLAIDGLSLLMILLTVCLGIFSILCSWKEINHKQGLFYFNLLWILGGIVGIFLSIDMLLFFVFWECMLIPMCFLISFWGCEELNIKYRIRISTKFFLYTQTSGIIMLVSIIALSVLHHNLYGFWTFSYLNFLCLPMSRSLEYLLMLGFFVAFAVKIPVIPLHGWLPSAHCCSPTAGSVDISGLLLKTGIYGLIRFNLTFFPNASQQFAIIAMSLGLINIFYGSLMAYSQTNIKKLISYSSISHMGFALLAIYSGNHLAYQGLIVHIFSHSISSAGMFIICGQLYERLYTHRISNMGGLWNRLNFLPGFFIFFVFAMLGIPGTGNFIGEITILFGLFQVYPMITIISIFGLIFTAIYSLSLIQKVCYGPVLSTKYLYQVTFREKLIIIFLFILVLWLGLLPQQLIKVADASIYNINSWFTNM